MRLFSFTIVSTIACAVVLLQPQPEDVGFIKPLSSPNPVAALVEAHGCWTQDGPVGVIPGHVIYDGRYLGQHATGQALDAVFGKSSPLDPTLVQGFCR